MASDQYHEPVELLSQRCKDMHRALTTLIEELEAVDWYQQRAEACTDDALRQVILHNRNEEIEHAMMTLEWIRRVDDVFERQARRYLFREGDIVEIEEVEEKGRDEEGLPPPTPFGPSLSVGSLRSP